MGRGSARKKRPLGRILRRFGKGAKVIGPGDQATPATGPEDAREDERGEDPSKTWSADPPSQRRREDMPPPVHESERFREEDQ